MASGGYEGDEGWLQGAVSEVGGRDVAFEVVHGDQGKLSCEGKALGRREADEESADEARAYRDGDAAHLIEIRPRIGERPLHDAVQAFEVRAGGDLGYYATVAFVLRLGVYDVREGATPLLVEDGGAGIIAGGFYCEDHAVFISQSGR